MNPFFWQLLLESARHHPLPWLRTFGDMSLLALCTLNFFLLRKARDDWRDAQRSWAEAAEWADKTKRYYDERAQMMIEALEKMAIMACPFCAAACGRAHVEGEDGEQLHAEAETDGQHMVRVSRGERMREGMAPCLAATIRADARKLFAETMEKAAA